MATSKKRKSIKSEPSKASTTENKTNVSVQKSRDFTSTQIIKDKAIEEMRQGIPFSTLKEEYELSILYSAIEEFIPELEKRLSDIQIRNSNLIDEMQEIEKKKGNENTKLQELIEKNKDYQKKIDIASTDLSLKTDELKLIEQELDNKQTEYNKKYLTQDNEEITSYLRKEDKYELTSIYKIAPVIILFLILGLSIGFFSASQLDNTKMNNLENQYKRIIQNNTIILNNIISDWESYKNETDIKYNSLLSKYNLINSPPSKFTNIKDLDITLIADHSVYSYLDPINCTLKISLLNGELFKGSVSFVLSMEDNQIVGFYRKIDGETSINIGVPAFRWGPGKYTLQLNTIYNVDGFIIASGDKLKDTSIELVAK
jgi:hypothetical protein